MNAAKELIERFKYMEDSRDWKVNPEDLSKLIAALECAMEGLAYTQRTDVVIGHDSLAEDGRLLGMPDKIMMRNVCKSKLEKINQICSQGE